MTHIKLGRAPHPYIMRAWTTALYIGRPNKTRPFEHPAEGSPRLAQFDRALSKRRAKNKVARASRKVNR